MKLGKITTLTEMVSFLVSLAGFLGIILTLALLQIYIKG